MELCHAVLTTPKTSPDNFLLTVVDMQQLPDIEIPESREVFCLDCKIYNGRRKVCVHFQTDTDNLNGVVFS